ncbi:MAG TPA: hypothetical protein VE133_16475, partial [Candidatus Sulfotelmatobacter sp.]|nr:hypothetical protein [Candidatus Sulfotelmatobacter sp.]
MKYARFMLSVVLISMSTLTLAQSGGQKTQTDAQKSFEKLKTLAGTWEGPVSMDLQEHGKPENTQVSLRVLSRGNSLVHEMKAADMPDDPARYDHPVTMFYLDGDQLLLTHYCDAGNRPRMVGKVSPD